MTPFETVKSNLLALEKASGRLFEKLLYEFSELSSLLYAEAGEDPFGEETAALFRQSRSKIRELPLPQEGTPREYLPHLRQQNAATDSFVLSAFSVFFAERVRDARGDLFPWEEARIGARIAYTPTGAAEDAYFALAKRRADASVLYADGTRAAIELLTSGRADYALLPYASASGEPLAAVSRLLTEGDFFLAALISVPREEERLMYALFSAVPAPFAFESEMRITLRLTAEDYAHLGRMLAAFPSFGYLQTDLLPEHEEYDRVCARVTLKGKGDPIALWAYLSFYSVGFSFLGRYPLIEI